MVLPKIHWYQLDGSVTFYKPLDDVMAWNSLSNYLPFERVIQLEWGGDLFPCYFHVSFILTGNPLVMESVSMPWHHHKIYFPGESRFETCYFNYKSQLVRNTRFTSLLIGIFPTKNLLRFHISCVPATKNCAIYMCVSIPLTTGRGTSAETCGLDDVFPPDDIGSRPEALCWYIYILAKLNPITFYRIVFLGSARFLGWMPLLFSLVYQLCLALW